MTMEERPEPVVQAKPPFIERLAALKEFSPEAWAKAQKAKDQEEQENASPIPVVFPVHP
jgi:hypothetical protein